MTSGDVIQRTFMQKAGVDRMAALLLAIDIVRRGGTISLVGVYGGMADPLPMLTIFDKQIQLRMGQANGPDAYRMFQQKADGAVKILLNP
jgi:threonine dehydrogenase-like Zn-dependent dehydrogenase